MPDARSLSPRGSGPNGREAMTQSSVLEAPALELMTDVSPALMPQVAVSQELSRLASGLGLSAVYGLALGAREGGLSLLRHGLGAPLGLLVVAGVAAPSLFVRLSLLDAPVRASNMLAAVSRATFAAGIVLAGLSPAMAMLVVSIESPRAAAWMSELGLGLAGSIGLFGLLTELHEALVGASLSLRSRVFVSAFVFALLSCALAARTWGAWLPLLGGAS